MSSANPTTVRLTIFHNGRAHPSPLDVSPFITIGALRSLVATHLSLPSHHLRLISSGKTLTADDATLSTTPLSSGGKLYVLATTAATIAAVRDARPDPLVRPFGRPTQRFVAAPRTTTSVTTSGEYGFARVEALPGFPDTDRATAILQGLADDVGFLSVMRRKRWRVGALKEMPPDGKVGVDPVCVLGYNVGKGMEIRLRLRTDDLEGFRPPEKIRQVLAHELAHNAISEHNDQFKELMRWIEKEADKADWRRSTGRPVDAGWSRGFVEGLDPLEQQQPDSLTTLSVVGRLGSAGPSTEGPYESSILKALTNRKDSEKEAKELNNNARSPKVTSNEIIDVQLDNHEEPPHDVEMQPKEQASQKEIANPAPSPTTLPERDSMHGVAAPSPALVPAQISGQPAPLSPVRTSTNSALDQLASFGFSRGLSTLALRENGCDVSRAADWLLSVSPESSEAIMESENDSEALNTQATLQRLCGSGLPQEQLISALDALHLYLSNTLRNPGVERFARINAANAGFHKRVGRHEDATALLEAAGFRLIDGAWLYKSSDSARLWVAKSFVQDKLIEELQH